MAKQYNRRVNLDGQQCIQYYRTFKCNEKKMFIVKMSEAACFMSEECRNRIITAERKYKLWKNRKVA